MNKGRTVAKNVWWLTTSLLSHYKAVLQPLLFRL